VLAGLVAGGAVFAAMHYSAGGDADRRAAEQSATSVAPAKNGIPAGWHRVEDPEGFSLLVPKGWKRQTDGDQIDYTPDNGRHRIRISVDDSPDFENPYAHVQSLENDVRDRLPDYRKILLKQNTYRDQVRSCLWEFTWTERKNFPGPRRAIDQFYYADDGTEYAIYMSSPVDSWETTRQQFDIVLKHWRAPGA
jgi:hypothetical protein